MKDKTRYNNHPLWDNVKGILASEDLKNLPSSTRGYVLHLLHDLDKRKDSTNPFYVQERSLDDLNNRLGSIASWLPNPNNASSIDQYVDACFNVLSSEWPANNGRKTADISKATYDAYLEDAAEKINSVRENADQVSELRNDFATEINELKQSIEELQNDASDSISKIEQDSQEKANELLEEFRSVVIESRQKTETTTNQIETDYVETLGKLNNQAQELLDKVKSRSSSISGWVIADSYGKYARNKFIATVIYDVLAVGFSIAGIVVVALALSALHADDTSATVFKFAVSVASFTVSGFLFKRGTFNQRESKAAKRTELTLRQYEPFIAILEESERRRITTAIAERIFIRGEIDDKSDFSVASAISNKGLSEKQMLALVEIAKTISKNQA